MLEKCCKAQWGLGTPENSAIQKLSIIIIIVCFGLTVDKLDYARVQN